MKFLVLRDKFSIPASGKNICYLERDNWNDYSFVTVFSLSLHDENGEFHKIGNLRIGFIGQTENESTSSTLDNDFKKLSDKYFSLGMGSDFYENLYKLGKNNRDHILTALRDIVYDNEITNIAIKESVFRIALLRDTSLTAIQGKYKRILEGKAELTPYNFAFVPNEENFLDSKINFHVKDHSIPSTNIHAIIGKNGSGKTTLFNTMIDSIVKPDESKSYFIDLDSLFEQRISKNYFSSLISVSFSAFDIYTPYKDQNDPEKGTCYFYVGLKNPKESGKLRNISELRIDLCESMIDCFRNQKKTDRWFQSIKTLSSDNNIKSMNLIRFFDIYQNNIKTGRNLSEDQFRKLCRNDFLEALPMMSSGNTIVLLSLFNLIATVDDRSLVLIDEPESHLHPPLLSAFIRSLSELLFSVNGVGIIATHSPVVLQEIPKSSVWKMARSGNTIKLDRPNIETFGENVGILTREIFGLEVNKSGFTNILISEVDSGKSFDEIYIETFNKQIGGEGLILLKTLISIRDNADFSND